MPPVASEHGVGVDAVIDYLALTTGSLLIIGTIALVGFIWRYGRGQSTGSPVTSSRSEKMWSVIPMIIMLIIAETGVMIMGMPVWSAVYGETDQDALVIEVVGRQFEWVARYPGEYEIACAELCGLGHYKMSGVIIVHESGVFEEWLTQQEVATL